MPAVRRDEAPRARNDEPSRDLPPTGTPSPLLRFDLRGVELQLGGASGRSRRLDPTSRPPAPLHLGPLDLTLDGGELVGLVGPSGIGKTSLLRALCGLSSRSLRGAVRIDGATFDLGSRGATRWFERARGRDLAWISAHGAASLDPRRRVGAQASELLRWFERPRPAEPAAEGERAALWAALALDVAPTLAARPDELSIGQGHRAALALALLLTPKILLVDEPAAALDDVTAALVWDRLREEAHARGRIVVVVDHDLERVLTRCDRVLVLARDETASRVHVALDSATGLMRARIAEGGVPACLSMLFRARGSATETTSPATSISPAAPAPAAQDPALDPPRIELRAVEPPHVTAAMRERPFDLTLRRGEIHALLGPSGIGKTSLLHVAVGLLRAASGEVLDDGTTRPWHVHGLDVTAAPALRALRRVTALVWQDSARALDPWHDVTTALRAPARHSGVAAPDDGALVAALREAGLGAEIRDQRVGTLSGGERQRVAILRALLAQPEVLVLDEPTAHLDAPRIHWLATQLQAARGAGVAILLATHDRGFAAAIDAVVHDLGERCREPMPPWCVDAEPARAGAPVSAPPLRHEA